MTLAQRTPTNAINAGYWLGEREHTILKEAWTLANWGNVQQADLGVSVGPPYPENMERKDKYNKMWGKLNRLRVDVMLTYSNSIYLIEVTPTVGSGSASKTQLYEYWYERDHDTSGKRIRSALLGRSANESIAPWCEANDVALGLVDPTTGLDWVVPLVV